MFTLPSPLHPAIVHFPIVLVVLGAAVAVAAVVINRWHLPWIAAALLALGGIGSYVAAETGEDAEDLAGPLTAPAHALLEQHEEAAERTEVATAIAAVLAIAAAAIGAFSARRSAGGTTDAMAAGKAETGGGVKPALGLVLRAATALAALTACYFIYETGHAGGQLVYEHGVGVKLTTGSPAGGDRTQPERH
jgi:uncharacterized membrane protein